MLYQIDYMKMLEGKQVDCLKEEIEYLWMAIQEKMKGKVNPKLILSERLSEPYEGWDSGPGPGFWRSTGWTPPPRCERGYYSNFYVSSTLKDFSAMIVHECGVDAIEITNIREDLL